MTDNLPGYSYGGNPEEESRRLTQQAITFTEYDLPLLIKFGLSKGMSVLDVGCGSGVVTLEIAKFVFPGQVVGIDRDQNLVEQAKQRHGSEPNLQFSTDDILSPKINNSFDFVYCRFVLWAVPDRDLALHNMIKLARHGGVICAQEPDAGGVIYWPDIPAHRQYWDGRIKYHQDREDGIDPTLGRKLYALFTQIGLTDIRVGVSALYKENFDWQTSVQNYVGPGADAIKAGYIDERVLNERAEWAKNPLSFMMFPTILVSGRKP